MPYKRKGRAGFFIAVPTRDGGRVKRATGTAHRATALAMERMVEVLGPRGKRDWDLLQRVVDNDLSVAALYDAYSQNALDVLRAEKDDIDLSIYVEGWLSWLTVRVRPDTVAHYGAHLSTLIAPAQSFPRSQ